LILYSCSANAPKHPSGEIAEDCLQYEPEKVQLTGRLYQKSFPGPPNYEDINNGDKKETYWFIKLKKPICVEDFKNQMDIQIIISKLRNRLNESMVGKFAILKGELFPQMTGHHRTETLITADSIEIIN
jgi:hypothetical protein